MGNTGVEGNLNGNGKETGNQDNLIGQAEKGVEKIGHQQEGGNKLPAENSQRQKEKTRFFPRRRTSLTIRAGRIPVRAAVKVKWGM